MQGVDKGQYMTLVIQNLGCASCAINIEERVRNLPDVRSADLDFATGRLRLVLDGDKDPDAVIADIRELAQDVEAGTVVQSDRAGPVRDQKPVPWRRIGRLATGLALFALAFLTDDGSAFSITVFIAAWLVLGYDVLISAARNLQKKRVFDENFLMSVATLGALIIGEYPEAVAVMLFYQIGELLQSLAVDRSRRSIRALIDLRPDQVTRLLAGEPILAEPQSLAPGDQILVRPGERVALDARVLAGQSSLDTAALTGESLPRPVGPGDEVLAGTINGSGLLTLEVTRVFGESAVSRILTMVEDAATRKAEAEQFITRFARIYTPVVVGLAVMLALGPPILGFGTFSEWLYRALVLLVISCPCALVLSVPLGYFAGLGAASTQGILLKGGAFLEKLTRISAVVFDKTGTLTEGRFTLTAIQADDGWTESAVLRLAVLAESHSSHPIAESLIRASRERGIDTADPSQMRDYQDWPGRGVSATIEDRHILLGNDRLMREHGVNFPKSFQSEECEAASDLHLAVDGGHAARFCLDDRIKAGAADFVAGLLRSGVRKTALLSGDRLSAVRRIAALAGVSDYRAELLPDQKVAALEAIIAEQGREGSIVYIGDGINDAPVLARADVGIALGAGSDAAIESADIVVMGDDLGKITQAIGIARRTNRIIRQNIMMALLFKAVIMILAVTGLAGIWHAVFADVGVALLAVFNSLRVIRSK